jgi:hypothetical protein
MYCLLTCMATTKPLPQPDRRPPPRRQCQLAALGVHRLLGIILDLSLISHGLSRSRRVEVGDVCAAERWRAAWSGICSRGNGTSALSASETGSYAG